MVLPAQPPLPAEPLPLGALARPGVPATRLPVVEVPGGLVPDLLEEPYWDAVVSQRHLALPLTITDQSAASFTGFVAGPDLLALIVALGVAKRMPEVIDDLVLHGRLGTDGALVMEGRMVGPGTNCVVSVGGRWSLDAHMGHADTRLHIQGVLAGVDVASGAEWEALASW